jgi:hypothetical protein
MEIDMRVNGKMALKQAMESCISSMAIAMRALLIKIALMGKGFMFSPMVIDMKVNLWRGCNMEEESILMWALAIMMVNGRMEGRKVRVR